MAHGAIRQVEMIVDKALRRLGPPTSVTKIRANELWLNPICMNKAITNSKTPALWSDTSNIDTII